MVLIIDAYFGNANDYRSQYGYVILLVDKFGVSNIIHYASNRFKRETRSVLAAEVHALVIDFYNAYVLRDMTHDILGRAL